MTNVSTPSGLLPHILADMVKDVCGYCPAHAYTAIKLEYAAIGQTKSRKRRSAINNVMNESFDLSFPMFKAGDLKQPLHPGYVPVMEVPSLVLLTAIKSSEFYARAVSSSVFSCWPFFVTFASMMILAGIVIWIVVGINKVQFGSALKTPNGFPNINTKTVFDHQKDF